MSRVSQGGEDMPKISEQERIAALEQRLKQLKTLQQRREAKARSVALHRSRRDDLRRKILVGAIVLAKVEAGEIEEKTLKEWLGPRLTKQEDRELFGLEVNQ
jgi:hypothetical protein